jgi:hypothetical protein
MFGCGGSSGGGSSAFKLFATDDLHPGYSGVWVKIFKADVRDSNGATVNLFSSTEGLTVNLRALNDGAAKFLLLAPGQLPNGSYNKITFELDKSVTLVATPSGTVSTANFPNGLDSTMAGRSNLSVDFSPVLVIPGTSKVAIDFDLKNWTVSGGVITPVLEKHNGNGLDDPTRHEKFEFRGIVSGLSGAVPTQTFTITLKNGGTVNVSTDDMTQIVADGATATLANGQKVEVYGAFDPLTNNIVAKIIRSESEFENENKAIGVVSSPNNVSKTFTLTPSYTRGFAPQGVTITVQTNSNTRFRGAHGVELTETQFYAALQTAGANTTAEVEGTYDSGTNTLTAKSVHYESESDMGEDEAKGTTTTVDTGTQTFSMSVSESDGFNLPGGDLPVALDPNVEIKDKNGNVLTGSAFMTLIAANAKNVEIKGAYSNSVFTASIIRIKN